MTLTHELMPQAAHRVIAARLSGYTQCVDEAAGLYIDAIKVADDHGLEVTVVDEHEHTLTVSLTSQAEAVTALEPAPAAAPATRTVEIPARDDHEGRASITVTLPWVCPSCGGPRGEVKRVVSYDGSLRLACDGWDNPCGYIDGYAGLRREAEEYASTKIGATSGRTS